MRIGRLRVVATIEMEDGSVEVTPSDERPFDRLQFERRFGESWPVLDEDGRLGVSDEHFEYMAWVQLHRSGLADHSVTPDDFDGWLVQAVSFDIEVTDPDAEDGEADAGLPTGATASTGG